MTKGSKRAKIKQALSPVRNLSPSALKSPSPSNHVTSPPPLEDLADEDQDDLINDLMAELDSRDKTVQVEAATVLQEIKMDGAVNGNSTSESSQNRKKDSKSRHQARQERKAAALIEKYAPIDANADAQLEREAQEEERVITGVCNQLGLEMHEITPDGHCLFSAIADQLALLGLLPAQHATYATVRSTAAAYLRAHPDDFVPFLPSAAGEDGEGASEDGLMTPAQFAQYCDSIENTGKWGGEPEIQALARAYGVPIHVVQGGKPTVVTHEPAAGGLRSTLPVMISYHRRMYGLGEHYNSLRPKRSA